MNADVLVDALVLAIELRQFVEAVDAEMTEADEGDTPRRCCCWRAKAEWYGWCAGAAEEEEESPLLWAGPPLLAKALTVDAPHIPTSPMPAAPTLRCRRPRAFHAGSSSETMLELACDGA